MHYKPWSMNKLCFKLFLSFSMADKYATCNKLYLVYEKKMLLKTTFSFLMWLPNSNTGVGFQSITATYCNLLDLFFDRFCLQNDASVF